MTAYREFSGRSRRRRMRQRVVYFFLFLLLAGMVLGVAYLVVKVAAILYPVSQPQEDFVPGTSLDEVLQQLEPDAPDSTAPESGGDTDTPAPTTPAAPEGPVVQTVDAAALTNPDYRMIALPENGRVDMSYFDDVTFIGDSLTEGIAIYNNNTFPNSDLAAWRGCSPMTLLTNQMSQPDGTLVNAVDYVVSTAPGKIYILLGSNALVSQSDDVILRYYAQLLDTLGERLPGVLIYVQAIPSTTAQEERDRAAARQDFSLQRISALNDQLAKLVYVRGLYFINLQEALCDADGYLRTEYDGGDGLHLNAEGYLAWRDYLLTHTAHRWDNPYLLGSPYYDPAANDAWLQGMDVGQAPAAQPAEGEVPPEGETPAEGQAPAAQPAEGEAPPEGGA